MLLLCAARGGASFFFILHEIAGWGTRLEGVNS